MVAVAVVLPIGLVVSPAGAAAGTFCASWNGSIMFSPPLPQHGDPTTVVPTVTGTQTISGCSGLGVTGGTAAFAGTFLRNPQNCDILNGTGPDAGFFITGTTIITWNTGQTSTLTGSFSFNTDSVTAGLFSGATTDSGPDIQADQVGGCATPLATVTTSADHPLMFFLPPGFASCSGSQSCDATLSASASTSAPGLSVEVTGKPSAATGTVHLSIASGVLHCPKVLGTVRPVANLTDTGFAPTDRLTVTATLPLASSTSAEQVCFKSTVPFKSQSNPTVAKAGTGLLFACAKVANVAPCVTSSQEVGDNVVVKFVVPGADPTFCIVLPTGREAWASHLGTGTVGTAYIAQFQTRGGKAPFDWNLSGRVPPGCAFDAKTGTITGRPAKKGNYTVVVQATDSEKPPKKTQSLSVPITIT